MRMKRGTIVLTLFPFTDLKTVKRRPDDAGGSS